MTYMIKSQQPPINTSINFVAFSTSHRLSPNCELESRQKIAFAVMTQPTNLQKQPYFTTRFAILRNLPHCNKYCKRKSNPDKKYNCCFVMLQQYAVLHYFVDTRQAFIF